MAKVLLVIRKIKFKIPVRYKYTNTRIAKMKKKLTYPVLENTEQLECLYIAGGSINQCNHS